MNDDREGLALLAAAAVGIQVGLATAASRFAIAETSPAALALMRYTIGAVLLAPFALRAWQTPRARRDLAPIALLGIVQFAVLVGLINYGLQTVPAARAALMVASYPLITLILCAALGWEKVTWRTITGVGLTLTGVTIALSEKLAGPMSVGSSRGELAVLAAAIAGAVCSVLYRPYLQRYPALPVGLLAMLASVAALLPAAALEGMFSASFSLSPTAIIAIVFIGMSSGIGYFLWLWALANTSPTKVSIFLGLSPIAAALVGALLLGEPLTWQLLIGLVAVLAGLQLATRPASSS